MVLHLLPPSQVRQPRWATLGLMVYTSACAAHPAPWPILLWGVRPRRAQTHCSYKTRCILLSLLLHSSIICKRYQRFIRRFNEHDTIIANYITDNSVKSRIICYLFLYKSCCCVYHNAFAPWAPIGYHDFVRKAKTDKQMRQDWLERAARRDVRTIGNVFKNNACNK